MDVVGMEMKAKIASLDDLFKRLVVNAETKRPQNRSLSDATQERTRR